MNTEVAIQVICQVDHEEEDGFAVDALREAAREAISNAVELSENAGFSHALAESICIGIASVSVDPLNAVFQDITEDYEKQHGDETKETSE